MEQEGRDRDRDRARNRARARAREREREKQPGECGKSESQRRDNFKKRIVRKRFLLVRVIGALC